MEETFLEGLKNDFEFEVINPTTMEDKEEMMVQIPIANEIITERDEKPFNEVQKAQEVDKFEKNQQVLDKMEIIDENEPILKENVEQIVEVEEKKVTKPQDFMEIPIATNKEETQENTENKKVLTPEIIQKMDNLQEPKTPIMNKESGLIQMYKESCKDFSIPIPNSLIITMLEELKPEEIYCLDLSMNYLGNQGLLGFLKLIPHFKNCERIILKHNGIRDSGVKELLKVIQDCPNITSLDLSDNPIYSKDLFQETKLKELILKGTRIN